MPDPLATGPASCPRCGYDQSGAIATWEQREPPACPLAGVCSECGLEFNWADVMRPWRHRVPGLFEHAGGVWQSVRWALRTWVMTLHPARFWRRVTIVAPVSVPRLLAWPVLVLGLVWTAGSLLHNLGYGVHFAGARSVGAASGGDWIALLNGWTSPLAQAWTSATPPSITWIGNLRGWIENFAATLAMTAAWPLLMLLLRSTTGKARVRAGHILRAAVYSTAWLPVLALVHVVDGVWSLGLFTPSRIRGFWPGFGGAGSQLLYRFWPEAMLAVTLWLSLWWYQAIRRGFRLPHAVAVWGLLLVAALLVEMIGLLWTGGGVALMARYTM